MHGMHVCACNKEKSFLFLSIDEALDSLEVLFFSILLHDCKKARSTSCHLGMFWRGRQPKGMTFVSFSCVRIKDLGGELQKKRMGSEVNHNIKS